MLWIEAYQPKRFAECHAHADRNRRLSLHAQKGERMAHTLLYGPSGCGKTTRVRCMVADIFGEGVWAKRRLVKVSIGDKEVSVWKSPHHTEISVAPLGSKDKLVIQTLVKETAELASSLGDFSAAKIHLIVIDGADRLTMDAQQALRRTMELYGDHCKLIMVARQIDSLIAPIVSRMFRVRLPRPTDGECEAIGLAAIRRYYSPADPPGHMLKGIPFKETGGNLKKALMLAQGSCFSLSTVTMLGRLSFCVREHILSMCEGRPAPSTVVALRKPLAELLAQVLSFRDLLEVLFDEGCALLSTESHTPWLQKCLAADRALLRSTEPLVVFEDLLLMFVKLVDSEG